MAHSSPRNPNVCASCEQLLEDDGVKLNRLFQTVTLAEPPARRPAEAPDADIRDTFSGSP